MTMNSDRYKAELLEDEGVNPEASGDEPKPPAPFQDPFGLLSESIFAIKKAIDTGQIEEAKNGIQFARTMINMGLSIAKRSGDGVLKTRLDGQTKLVDEQEARL